MKTWLIALALALPALACAATAGPKDVDEYALEPCINGDVSANGLFASQAEEDAWMARMAAD